MSESGQYSDNDTSDEETDFSSEEEEEDGAEYSLGEYYDEDEDLYCEDSGEDNLGYSDHDTAEDFSDREPEIVCGGAVAPAAGSRAGRGRGRGSRAWDLSVVILALCVAIIFGYYSVM